MNVFTKRCGCGKILALRETCPRCAEAKRAEALAKAGERPTPPVKTCPSAWENVPPYPESRYEPASFIEALKAEMAGAFASFGEAAAKSAYAPRTPAGRLAVLEEFAAAGLFGPQVESVPFDPETFCPPGREALERAGYECLTEARGGGLAARHPDGNAFYGEVPAERLSGDQAERFLTFAWETMALDAGLDGILSMIEDGDEPWPEEDE